jgi:rhodanese-related sulfurtransferase
MEDAMSRTVQPASQTPRSFVLDIPAASPDEARRHFLTKLSVECDAWDVHEDQRRGSTDVVLVDTRTAAAYADMHVPGSLLLPSRSIDEASVGPLRGKLAVVYCWGTGCNAATKAAARLAALGIQVKEMIGGLESWLRNGYPVEGALPAGVGFDAYLAWHHSHSEPYRPAR